MADAFSADSSCLIAAVCAWHEHHDAAFDAMESRRSAGRVVVLAGHALAETYGVLTRLPPPHRLAPADAGAVIQESFVRGTRLAALPGSSYAALVRRLAQEGMSGGRIYNGIIAESARRARATTLLTFKLPIRISVSRSRRSDAMDLLRRNGYRAHRMESGVAEWRSRGWRVEEGVASGGGTAGRRRQRTTARMDARRH
jgi:predicted nucleic acid-binding protein